MLPVSLHSNSISYFTFHSYGTWPVWRAQPQFPTAIPRKFKDPLLYYMGTRNTWGHCTACSSVVVVVVCVCVGWVGGWWGGGWGLGTMVMSGPG